MKKNQFILLWNYVLLNSTTTFDKTPLS